MNRHGFTGTQTPGPGSYDLTMRHLVTLDPELELVVGCCIGMDVQIAYCAAILGFRIHGVVPANRSKVDISYCTTLEYMPPGTSYMQRNDRMVEISTVGYTGFPKTAVEELRSGTWATLRRAWKKFGKHNVTIIPVGGN